MAKAKKTPRAKTPRKKAPKKVPQKVPAKTKVAPPSAAAPRKPKAEPTPRQLARRARIATIRARTIAAQLEIDRFIADVEFGELAHLPVMVEHGSRRPNGSWRNTYDRREPRDHHDPDHEVRRRLEAKAKQSRKGLPWQFGAPSAALRTTGLMCQRCKLPEHGTMSCREIVEWMNTSAKVFSGELASPEGVPTPRVVPTAGLPDPKKMGRPRGRRLSLQERSAIVFARADPADLKTASAAASCPAPSPSP